MNLTNTTTTAVGAETLSTLVNTITIIFFTMALGFVGKLTGFIPASANKGIGPMVGKICLPLLIFRNVAKLDLSTVEVGIVASCAIVKVCSFTLAMLVACVTRPTGKHVQPGDDASRFGIMTLFCTGSNDLAIGLAIIQSIYPVTTSPIDFGSITFVIVGMQVSIFNIPSFVLLELGKGLRAASKKEGKICPKKLTKLIAFNLLKNPILLSTFLGLLYNVANPPVSGDLTSNKNIPYLLDEMMAKGGSAFGMAALFLGGMAVVGKFQLLGGRKLVLPVVLSLIKVLVAPIIGFFVANAIFAGHVHQTVFSEYVFIYSSLPTAGSIIVFAQAYDVALKDLISGASVVVLLLWSPIMYITVVLLVGGSISAARVADVSHVLSIMGGIILVLTSLVSSDWKTHPKRNVAQMAFVALLFSISHIGCYQTLEFNPSGWDMAASTEWYFLTYFFRTWLKMIVGFVIPTDLMLLWLNGRTRSPLMAKIFPIASVVALVVAAASAIGFALGGVEEKSLYACWYRYGNQQITYDLVLLFVQLIYGILVLGIVGLTSPPQTSINFGNGATDFVDSAQRPPATTPTPPRSFVVTGVAHDTLPVDHAETVETVETVENDESDENLENAGHAEQTGDIMETKATDKEPTLHQEKCNISGGYVYRTKLLIAVTLVSVVFQILGNRSARSNSLSAGEPILDFLQIINIFITDGSGFIMFLIYITMRSNGWVKVSFRVRTFARSCLVLNVVKGEGQQQGESTIPITWKRLANQLASSRIIQDRRYRLRWYSSCTTGKLLLQYLVEMNMATTLEEATAMCQSLYNYQLLHHVTHEHDISEIDSDLFFHIVSTSAITEQKKPAVGSGNANRRPSSNLLVVPPSPTEIALSLPVAVAKPKRLSSRELMSARQHGKARRNTETELPQLTRNRKPPVEQMLGTRRKTGKM